MSKKCFFRDYLTSSGRNEIRGWLQGLPRKAKAKVDTILLYLEVDGLGMPYTRPLKGDGKGLLEVRITYNSVEYRPLGFQGPGTGQVTLLVGATERDSKFDPPSAIRTAQDRKKTVLANPERACEHDYEN